jgi:ferredoxin
MIGFGQKEAPVGTKPKMAHRLVENVPGTYYVVDTCNGCGLCLSLAPNNFTYTDDASYYYVLKQPQTPEEEEQCKEAKQLCPVDCILDDGGKYESIDDGLYY